MRQRLKVVGRRSRKVFGSRFFFCCFCVGPGSITQVLALCFFVQLGFEVLANSLHIGHTLATDTEKLTSTSTFTSTTGTTFACTCTCTYIINIYIYILYLHNIYIYIDICIRLYPHVCIYTYTYIDIPIYRCMDSRMGRESRGPWRASWIFIYKQGDAAFIDG